MNERWDHPEEEGESEVRREGVDHIGEREDGHHRDENPLAVESRDCQGDEWSRERNDEREKAHQQSGARDGHSEPLTEFGKDADDSQLGGDRGEDAETKDEDDGFVSGVHESLVLEGAEMNDRVSPGLTAPYEPGANG